MCVIAEHQAAAAVVVLEQRQSVGGGHRVRLGSAEAAPDPLKKNPKNGATFEDEPRHIHFIEI